MSGSASRWSLLVAALLPAALIGVLLLDPGTLARVPIAIAAIVWAPGHAGLALLHPLGSPRLGTLERAALAPALGLLAAPLIGLAVSLAWTLTPMHVAVASLALTSALALGAWLRGRRTAQGPPAPLVVAPSAPVTFALSGGALLVAAGIFAFPLMSADAAPAALSLVGPDGRVASLPTTAAPDAPLRLQATLAAGDAPREGRLTATLEGDASRPILDTRAVLPAGGAAAVDMDVPALPPGDYKIVVRWDLPQPLETHFWLRVRDAPAA